MDGALKDIVVLDLTQVLAGPFGVTILADFGADVIKIEPPGGDYTRHLFASQTKENQRLIDWSQRRNRRGVTLNLQSQKGREIFLRLVEKADVVVQNFAIGVMERLGLGYDTLKEVKPDIIYCAMSGYGQTGPYKDKPGYDPIIQAASGMMAITGFPEGPPVRVGTQIGDIAGGVYAVLGILLALHYRDVTGKGQMVDCAMLDALSHWTMLELFAGINITGKERHGNRHPVGITNIYKTSDDQHVILFILSDAEWERSLKLFGKEELVAEKWTARTRIQRRDEADQWISEWMRKRTLIEADNEMTEARIAHHKVTGIRDLETDPQIEAREMLVSVNDPEFDGVRRVRGTAPRLTETPGSVGTPDRVPVISQHTEEVLSQMLNYSKEEVDRLSEEGVV